MATNISDLSVGDWVEYEGLHYPITFVGYGEGGDGCLVNLIRPDLSCFTCKISDIRPIPITAEILEKNGWKCVEVGDNGPSTPKQYYNRYEKWRLEAAWGKRELIFDRMTKIYRLKGMTDCGFAVVHKLQHALRLSGFYNYDINL